MSTATPSRVFPCCAQIRGGRKGVQCSRNRQVGKLTCWQHTNLEDFIREQLIDAGDKMFSKVMILGKRWMAPLRFPNEIVDVADSLYIQASSEEDDDESDDGNLSGDDESDEGKLSGDEELLSGGIPKVRFVAAAQRRHRQKHRLQHHHVAPLHNPQVQDNNLNLLISAHDAISELTSSSGTASGSALPGEQSQSPRLSPLRDLRSPPASTASTTDDLDQPRSMPMSPASTANLMDTPLPAEHHHFLSRFLNRGSRQTPE